MSEPTCDDVAPLIDLYAAGECGPAEEKAVRAHVGGCDRCRDLLDEARRLQGLLDAHFGQPAALARLEARVKAEARRSAPAPPRGLPFQRFAAIAALLLVTFGLGLLLPPPAANTSFGLQLALEDRAALIPALPARGGPEKMAVDILEGKRRGKWPLPPRVDLELIVRNPGTTPIEMDVGGDDFRCEIELSGPGKVQRHAPARPEYVPFPAEKQTIEPGGTLKLRLERLASQWGRRVTYYYPTVPGDYVLRVRLEASARRGGQRERVRLAASPWRLPFR
jgi:hypothetical protein